MFVANRMTENPITVEPNAKVDEAALLMKRHKFRRLPVVEAGRLVGFLSERDILKVAPSPATTLSKYEINSLLAKLCVKDIMQQPVISVPVEATIEEAALLMCTHKIGGLPVISSVGAVVGIITETDVFRAFVDAMGLARGKTRLTLEVEDRVGTVKEIAAVFTQLGLSIDSLHTCKKPDGKYEVVIRGDFPAVEVVQDKLEGKGFKVVHTVQIG